MISKVYLEKGILHRISFNNSRKLKIFPMFYMNKEKTGVQHQEKLQNIWTQRHKHIIEWWTGHWRSQVGSWKFG